MTKDTSLSSTKLRQLLIDLKEHGPNTCIRVRLIGELWQNYFMRVVSVTDERLMLNDEVKNRLISSPLSSVMQIELDHKFREYDPHNHYTIHPDKP